MALREDLTAAAANISSKVDQLIVAIGTNVPAADIQAAITTLNDVAARADAVLNPPPPPPPAP